jgi:hypothetical protein
MKNRISKRFVSSIKQSYLEEYKSIKIRTVKDYKDAVPESINSLPDSTQDSRSYAYGQGCSIFVKIAERKKLECINTNI